MYADIIILAMLNDQPLHGYDIKKKIELVLGNFVNLNNKVLYPALKRFEEMGAVQREVVRQEGKPDRHIYQLTDRGTEVLQSLLLDFSPELAQNSSEFLTRVGFFNLIEPEARIDILTLRMDALKKRLVNLQLITEKTSNVMDDYAVSIMAFQVGQIQQELDWINSLKHDAELASER